MNKAIAEKLQSQNQINKMDCTDSQNSVPPASNPCDDEQALKVAGFSLSAIEEMRRTRNVDDNKPLDHQLRQFQVLDEVGSCSDDADTEPGSDGGNRIPNNKQQHRGDDGEDSSDYELDDDELENLLDENLPDELKGPKKPKYEERFKTVLEEKRHNHFEMLPEGWVQVTHNSGMPLFLHRKTRVCCASRPYFLGAGSARKHAVPVGAIPCLNYRRALDEEADLDTSQSLQKKTDATKPDAAASTTNCEPETSTSASKCPFATRADENIMETDEHNAACVEVSSTSIGLNTQTAADAPNTSSDAVVPSSTSNGGLGLKKLVPAAKIVTVNENTQKESLTPDQLNEYCTKLFKFKVIRVLRFRTWNERRKFTKNRKHIKNIQRPTLPDGTKLIKFPVLAPGGDGNANPRMRKEWIMNPNGKSYVCILHEYVQHALKMQPTYEFKELQNAATPYSATVSVNNLKYGTGYGTSKKQAKSEAARVTLEILIPEMKDKITGSGKDQKKNSHNDLSVFDDIQIEDPRVTEFCNKTTEPTPHAILLTCLQRNHGLGDVQINYEINRIANKKNEFTMTVGKHTARVHCKNKREGKQLASQAILQLLHPHIKTWGSLLRLYGNNSIKTFKEKKLEEQEITVLQSKAAVNQPNYAILDKLKSEMLKLSAKHEGVHSMGTFVPPSDVDLPSTSGSNLNNVEL